MFAAVGVAAYLVALVATVPAAFVVPRSAGIAAVGGTVWHGQAALAGGSRLEWRWAPLRSLANLAFAADVEVSGTGSAMAGRALVRPASVRLDDLSGTADAALLDALAPGLAFTCDIPLQIDLRRVVLGGAAQQVSGTVLGEAGSCRPKAGGAAVPVAPLAFTAEHVGRWSQGTLAPAAQRRRVLGGFRLSQDGALSLSVTRDGAAALPFAAPPAGLTVDTRL